MVSKQLVRGKLSLSRRQNSLHRQLPPPHPPSPSQHTGSEQDVTFPSLPGSFARRMLAAVSTAQSTATQPCLPAWHTRSGMTSPGASPDMRLGSPRRAPRG